MAHQQHEAGPLPPTRWGRDHVTTLLYLEARVVDHAGTIKPECMRSDGDAYPTVLAGGEELPGHTDWHCLADFREAGLLTGGERRPFKEVRGRRGGGGGHASVSLTDEGWRVAGALRRFRSLAIPSAKTVFTEDCTPKETT